MKKLFTKGNKLAKGGARPNTGPKPDEFKRKCAEIASSPEWMAYCKQVLSGEAVVEQIGENGNSFRSATPGERSHLFEKLAAYGFGKPTESVEISGQSGGPIKWTLEIVAANPNAKNPVSS